MKLIFVTAAALLLVVGGGFAAECPDIPFVKDFEPARFLGKWRAIQTTGIDMACGAYDAYDADEQGKYRVTLLPVRVENKLRLNRPNDFSLGFTEESPIELLNKANLRVFATDYDRYAGVIECKNADGLFFLSATIAARSGALDNDIIEKLKQQLASYGIDTGGFKVVRQDGC